MLSKSTFERLADDKTYEEDDAIHSIPAEVYNDMKRF